MIGRNGNKMNMGQLKSVCFLGIGGIGMSALARYFNSMGIQISGYDKTPTSLTDQLIQEGMKIHFEEDIDQIPRDADLFVYTPAIPKDNAELNYIIRNGFPLKKRAEVLGMISGQGNTIAIAGTHGKTTTATLLAHILKTAGTDMMAFLGGISKNYNSNFIPSFPHSLTPFSPFIVVEADEFDRSFLQLQPLAAVITSVDADHLDIYGTLEDMKNTYREFTGKVKPGGFLVLKKGVDLNLLNDPAIKVLTYSIEEKADYSATHLKVSNGTYLVDIQTPTGMIRDITVGIPGRFNLENSVAAFSVTHRLGIPEGVIRESLKTFRGVQRRFELHLKRPDFVYMDDYAHHPEELKACIGAVKEVYPGKKITGVFQPHLFSRTLEFADEFARSLEMLDDIILLDIYPAREKPIEGVDSAMLLRRIRTQKKTLCARENLIDELVYRNPEVLLTLGAGDIDQLVSPIIKAFEKQ
jgi:UDP-N-acetylmuramate--alanine ligase